MLDAQSHSIPGDISLCPVPKKGQQQIDLLHCWFAELDLTKELEQPHLNDERTTFTHV